MFDRKLNKMWLIFTRLKLSEDLNYLLQRVKELMCCMHGTTVFVHYKSRIATAIRDL